MNPIVSPLTTNSRGSELKDLQDALQQFLERGIFAEILGSQNEELQFTTNGLHEELSANKYGDFTLKLVGLFQKIKKLRVGEQGSVDAVTADAINTQLRTWKLLDEIPPTAQHLVVGALRFDAGLPPQGILVRAFHETADVKIRLGEDATDAEGRYTIRYEPLAGIDTISLRVAALDAEGKSLQTSDLIPQAKPLEIVNIAIPFIKQPDALRSIRGHVVFDDGYPAEDLHIALYSGKFGAGIQRIAETKTIEQGQYTFEYQVDKAATRLDVRALKKFNSPLFLLSDLENSVSLATKLQNPADPVSTFIVDQFNAETRQNLQVWQPGTEVPEVLARALINELNTIVEGPSIWNRERFAGIVLRKEVQNLIEHPPQNEEVPPFNRLLLEDAYTVEFLEVPLSKPIIDLQEQIELNLVAPLRLHISATEYERLVSDLAPHIGDMSKLADLKENTEQQDLSYLHRTTGWDARIIALASISEQLGKDADVNLEPKAIYGLLRAGLPHDKAYLAQIEPDVIKQTLNAARNAGIVALDDQVIAATEQRHAEVRDNIRLAVKLPGSRASLGDMLKITGLTGEKQSIFASVVLNHTGTSEQLWQKVADKDFNQKQIKQLKLQGKYAFLSGNSEQLTSALIAKNLNTPLDLVEQGFYESKKWQAEILGQANIPPQNIETLQDIETLDEAEKHALEKLIPPAYQEEKLKDRLAAYTEDMARKLRVSYPMQVLMHRIENDDNYKPLATNAKTTQVLRAAIPVGFQLGNTPVDTFFEQNKEIFSGVDEIPLAEAKKEIKTLFRLYQISPSDQAMATLNSMGVSSAHDIVDMDNGVFLEKFTEKYLGLFGEKPSANEGEWVVKKTNNVSVVA